VKHADVYVLRIWQEAREVPNWRASLSNLHGQEKTYFTSPDELISFLKDLITINQTEIPESSHPKS
jgi:hypothetical protein